MPGAIGGFRREALVGAGLVSNDTLAEDTDLTMAILRDGWRVVYRQLMYVVVIQSVFTAMSGMRLPWRRMERYGSLTVPAGEARADSKQAATT